MPREKNPTIKKREGGKNKIQLVLSLLRKLGLDGLLPLLQLALGLETHDTPAPLPLEALVELGVEVGLQGVQLGLVFLVDGGQADDRGVLLVHQGTEASLHHEKRPKDKHH